MADKGKRILGMKAKNTIGNTAIYIILTLMSIVWLIPFVCIVLQSFRTESTHQVGYIVPTAPGLDNYKNLFVASRSVATDEYLITVGDEKAKAKSEAKIAKQAAVAAAKAEAMKKALEAAGRTGESSNETVVAKITSQSTGRVLCIGDTAEFAITAEGHNLTYQWQYLDPAEPLIDASLLDPAEAKLARQLSFTQSEDAEAAEEEGAEAGSEDAAAAEGTEEASETAEPEETEYDTIFVSDTISTVSLVPNWQNIDGAASNSLQVPVTEANDGFSYRCVVSGNYPLKTEFVGWYTNTFIMALIVAVLQTIIVLCMSYTLSRFRFKMRKPLMKLMLILGLFPGMLTMIILYRVLKDMGLTMANAVPGLILVYIASSGMGYYISKGFFDTIPMSLDEAARVDGATRAQVLWNIILPLSKPIVIYTILTAFMGPWGDFVFAKFISFNNSEGMNVAVGLYKWLSKDMINDRYTMFCAGGVVVAIPVTILFMCLQKYYVEGVTGGSVKG